MNPVISEEALRAPTPPALWLPRPSPLRSRPRVGAKPGDRLLHPGGGEPVEATATPSGSTMVSLQTVTAGLSLWPCTSASLTFRFSP